MPRQNFLSLESFVEATETQAKESLLSVPVFAANIKLIAENEKLQSFKFRYQLPLKNLYKYSGLSDNSELSGIGSTARVYSVKP